MTTTVIVHNSYRAVTVETFDQVYDHHRNVMTDEWKSAGSVTLEPGQLCQTYCTDTRKIVIHEPPMVKNRLPGA